MCKSVTKEMTTSSLLMAMRKWYLLWIQMHRKVQLHRGHPGVREREREGERGRERERGREGDV